MTPSGEAGGHAPAAQHLELHLGSPVSLTTEFRAVALDSYAPPDVRSLEVVLNEASASADLAAPTGLIARLPGLRGVVLTSDDAANPHWRAVAMRLAAAAKERSLAFAVDFELDPEADAFAALARPADRAMPLATVLRSSRQLRDAGIAVRWLVPLSRTLIYRLEPLFSLARDEGVEPVLVPPWYSRHTHGAPADVLDADERLFASDFIGFRVLGEERGAQTEERRAWYELLHAAVRTEGAIAAGAATTTAILVPAEGGSGWLLGHASRPGGGEALDTLRVPTPPPAGEGPNDLRDRLRDVGSVLTEGGLALAQRLRAALRRLARPGRAAVPERLASVLLVGAYGGDHIGDTAILGGVLLRLHRRYGTARAVLMSQRADHTRHLVPMLDTPVPVEVDAYELAQVRARMPTVDAVVFAGGPLIDLPKQLVKHFYAASLAARSGKPFLMEGIGPGPFPRWPSQWTARRLVRMAGRISVRTSTDVHDPLMRGVTAEPGRDPAFDYLATRTRQLTRLRPQDQEWIDRLLAATEGRVRIGINLRPIRHLFTLGAPAGERERYTRMIESQCERNLAEGMARFHRASEVPPCFIFFPMNAIQFGSSDLRSAYRLRRALDTGVDFRVWQADAGLDGVVALLRSLDVVITMRFHATIFALSQQRKVIGIDYRIGKQDKVGALMSDVGQDENCRRIDEIDADWLFDRLVELTGKRAGG